MPTTDSIEALSENDSAVDVMGDTKLKLIAHELLQSVRSNATIDWHHSEMARAKIRVAAAAEHFSLSGGSRKKSVDTAVQFILGAMETFKK